MAHSLIIQIMPHGRSTHLGQPGSTNIIEAERAGMGQGPSCPYIKSRW